MQTQYTPTNEELLDELRVAEFNLSVQNERIITCFEMIAELSELIVEMNDYMQESIDDINQSKWYQPRQRNNKN